jgi:chromosome segregation ATPase
MSATPTNDLEELIENATVLSKSLAKTANEFVATLWLMKNKILEIEADLNRYRAEMAQLHIEIEQRIQEHQELEENLAGLRDHIAQHQDKADYVRRLDEILLQTANDREDLERRIKLTLQRQAA